MVYVCLLLVSTLLQTLNSPFDCNLILDSNFAFLSKIITSLQYLTNSLIKNSKHRLKLINLIIIR